MFSNGATRLLPSDRRLLTPAAIIGAWTIVALAAAVQAVALVHLDGRADTIRAVLGRVSIIPLWAIATPFILRSARRFPVVRDREVVPASIAMHLALGSLFIVFANAVIRIPVMFGDGGVSALVRSTMQGVAEYYPPAIVVYGVIVAIGHFVFRAPIALPAEVGETPASTAVVAADGHITIRQWNRMHLVRVEDIDFVEAEDNYVVVHAASRTYKGRDRISDVESQLDSRRFVRIHRSTIVHVAKIREVQPLSHGDHAVVLHGGKVLRVARSRRQALGAALGVEL
jgi:two-component system LytT family response regulator